MAKIIISILFALLIWFIHSGQIKFSGFDFSNSKGNIVEKLKKDKTIDSVNSSRNRTQNDIYDVSR